ncbi:MAG: glycosyltransferase [bacterium]|nr:glycosyltransferase [bacterium]
MKKKVSIILVVYNTSKYLRKCLTSLVNQTLKEIEIIAINNGSTDDSIDILKEYQQKYPDILKVIDNKAKSIGETRNEGIEHATGEYIGFIDDDDFVDTTMYEEYYKYAKENKLDIVVGNYIKCFESTLDRIEFKVPYFDISNIYENKQILNKINCTSWGKIYKKDIINKNNIIFAENLKYEDVVFVYKALINAKRIGHINKSMYYYLIRKGSETTTVNSKIFDIFAILDIVNSYNVQDKLKEEVEYFNINIITLYMLKQRYQKNKKLRNKFYNEGYKRLNKIEKWKQNKYYKNTNIIKRIIINNKLLLKIYCYLYQRLRIEIGI